MGVLDVEQNEESAERFWQNFHGPNKGYIEEQYDLYKEDPNAVDSSLKDIFAQYGAPVWLEQPTSSAFEGEQAASIDVKKTNLGNETCGGYSTFRSFGSGYLSSWS